MPIFIALLCVISVAVANEPAPVTDVVVIEAGERVLYKYRNESGQVVVQDRPPLGYYEQLAAPTPRRSATRLIPLQVRAADSDGIGRALATIARMLPWLFLALGIAVLATPPLRRLLREPALLRHLRRAGFEVFTDVELRAPSGVARRIECLARTPAGIVVITTVRLHGQVAGQARSRHWRLRDVRRQSEIDNPLIGNATDVRLVEEILSDAVPVFGRVVNTGRARFRAGIPVGFHDLATFRASLPHFAQESASPRNIEGSWRILMRYPRSNSAPRKVFGVGWKAWAWRRRRLLTAGLLAAMAATSALAVASGAVG